MKKTALYLRSPDSIELQKQKLLRYTKDNLNENQKNIIILKDNNPRFNVNSKEYQKLLNLIEKEKIDKIVIENGSRIANDIETLYQRFKKWIDKNIEIHILKPQIKFKKEDKKALESIKIAVNLKKEFDKEKIRTGIKKAKSEGKHIGRPPFGFDSQNGTLKPNDNFETALKIIRKIEKGESKRSTAKNTGVTRATVKNIFSRKNLYRKFSEK